MHCGPPNQNFGRAMAHRAHVAALPMVVDVKQQSVVQHIHDAKRAAWLSQTKYRYKCVSYGTVHGPGL